MGTKVRDIRDASPDQFGEVRTHRQSRYVVGLCEKCGGPIACNEVHETRAWLNGPAELCQHIECPVPAHPTGPYRGTDCLTANMWKGVGDGMAEWDCGCILPAEALRA